MKKKEDNANLYHTYYNLMRRKDVKVCQIWKNSYKVFEKWCLENGYCDGARIVRIDKTKPFQPSNVKIVCSAYAKNMKSIIKKCKGQPISHIRITIGKDGKRN